MNNLFFNRLYKNLEISVLVFKNSSDRPLIYANPSAKMLLNPLLVIDNLDSHGNARFLSDILCFDNQEDNTLFFNILDTQGSAVNFSTKLSCFDDEKLEAVLNANSFELENKTYCVIYIDEKNSQAIHTASNRDTLMSAIFHTAYNTVNIDDAINAILRMIGEYCYTDRAYIFEEISSSVTRNTYEWCSENTSPAIQDLQNLKKDEYNYESIITGGMCIVEDVRSLPLSDRNILDPQCIKSFAILPLYVKSEPIGYIGVDACNNYKKWYTDDLLLLQNASKVITALITRRNAENRSLQSLKILQTISDKIDDIIYVSDVDTYNLLFVNKALANLVGKDPEELIGKKCWDVLQYSTEPCHFCPIKYMIDKEGYLITDTYNWEFKNLNLNKWFMIKDSIFEWFDGKRAHIETAVEINDRKEYEEQLEYYASTDVMSGTFNREWGYKLIGKIIENCEYDPTPVTLCFIDIDGLKKVNDTFGHDYGDEMIIRTVKNIRSVIRQSDIICRWGGDEFVVILHCDLKNSQKIMNKVQDRIGLANLKDGKKYNLAFSYGLTALSTANGMTVDSAVFDADKLMYEDKMSKILY